MNKYTVIFLDENENHNSEILYAENDKEACKLAKEKHKENLEMIFLMSKND